MKVHWITMNNEWYMFTYKLYSGETGQGHSTKMFKVNIMSKGAKQHHLLHWEHRTISVDFLSKINTWIYHEKISDKPILRSILPNATNCTFQKYKGHKRQKLLRKTTRLEVTNELLQVNVALNSRLNLGPEKNLI